MKTKTKKKERTVSICPYSKETDFLVEMAEHLPLSPLDLYDDEWEGPLAARWLNAGLSGQDTPNILRAGLKRLRTSQHFLVQEKHRLATELAMKQKALDNPRRKPLVYVAEQDSIDAQQECLELFLSYLPKRYPNLYTYDENAQTITVHGGYDCVFSIEEYKDQPLELCERIVQEDLILMRPARSSDPFEAYAMAAAAVVFSFNELAPKLGQPVEFIHAPVPGFEAHLRKSLELTFSKLKSTQPLWRNNWGIAPSGTLDEPLYGSDDAQEHRTFTQPTIDAMKSKWLKVEYQTIRRLPRSNNLLFTVKTMADPLHSLEKYPLAAECLANSIRGMSPSMRAYKGIVDNETADVLLAYLRSICENKETDTTTPPTSATGYKKEQ